MGRKTVAMILAMWVIPVSVLVNQIVPDPYMDEIFHIPQAQMYCKGNFRSWDPMITTPPGLYLLSLAYIIILYPITWFRSASFFELCSISTLRSINGALSIIIGVLIYDIFLHLKPTVSERRATFYAVGMSLYPLHWFFTFLYYTDVASVASILAMYLASLKRKYWASAMFGAVAVFMRQTNVIWMLFIAASVAIDYTEMSFGENHVINCKNESVIQNEEQPEGAAILNKSLRRRKPEKAIDNKPLILVESDFPSSTSPDLLNEIIYLLPRMWCLKWKMLLSFGPFILIILAFVCFVIWNGSIVLGAKDAHSASLHFAQLMYFGLVSAIVMAPVHLGKSNILLLYNSFSRKMLECLSMWLMALIFGFTSVHFFSIAHPYLLADNRHYTFYIWRKIINAHWTAKYILVPLYVYSWFSIISILGKSQKKTWVVLFILACVAVLVPAPLIEFRYYTIPIFIMFFHIQIDDNISWLLMISCYVVVNVFTMVMFLFRPFQWAHEPGFQRFIW